MIQSAWVQFPKVSEPITKDVVLVEMQVRMWLKPAEGPLISQIGPMLEVFAGIAKTANATHGEFVATWIDDYESVPSGTPETASSTESTPQQEGSGGQVGVTNQP